MEFHITLPAAPADLVGLGETLRRQDPGAMVDIDAGGHTLRVSSSMAVTDLAEAFRGAGLPIVTHDIVQQPSVCCGGCSG